MIISAKSLTRHFVVRENRPGLFGAVRGLFGGRRKRTVQAVENASFELRPGEILGLIGPNGAGKSTTVKMAAGILRPTSGNILTLGLDPFRRRIEVARRYGAVFGQRSQLWWSLSPQETFRALAQIYDVEPAAARRQTDYLVETFEITEFLATPVRQLSLGQRVRCDIAAALIHRPELLFLDEPTIGLDVVGKSRVREHIGRVNREQGVAVLLTSHDMVDVERLCSRVLVIGKGAIVYDGPLEPLRREFAPDRQLVLDLAEAPGALELDCAQVVRQDRNRLVLRFDGRKSSAMDILAEISRKHEVLDFSVDELPIDEVIARMYQRGFGEHPAEKEQARP